MKNSDLVEQADFVPIPHEADILKTISCGQQYMNTHIPQKTSVLRLFYDQIRYISPLLWLVQFGALVLLIITAFTAQDMSCGTAQNTMLLLASLTAIFAVPEFYKDVFCGVLEMELTCKNSGASIFSIRLIIIAFMNIAMITFFSLILSYAWKIRFLSVIRCGLLPINIIYIINFMFFRIFRIHSRLLAFSFSVLSGIFVYVASANISVVSNLSEGAWWAIVAVTLIILVEQCIHVTLCLSKRQGVMLWNY